MYINEVLRACDTLCPNEYSDEEKYRWCDELSAMLSQEYLKKYNKVTVEAEQDGSYLLPEGVTFEMVDRIIDGAREIDKCDFRSYGIKYYYGRFGRFVFPVRNRVRGSIEVVYLKKHEPIRNTVITQIEGFSSNFLTIKRPMLEVGDSVDITVTVTENEQDTKYRFEQVLITDIVPNIEIELFPSDTEGNTETTSSVDDSGEYLVFLPEETLRSVVGKKVKQWEVKRIVTEETVCDAPYDRMYIDYVNAQICYYQRDFDTYNQHMNLFNQRLMAYQAWLQQRRVQDKDGKITNWW